MFGRDGKSRGFGFVLYKDEANNKKILGMESLTLEGRSLDVKLRNSQPVGGGRFRGSGGGPPKSKKVFIGRLSDEVESADLREHFEQFGKIVDIFMPMVRCPASLLLLLLLCLLFLFLSSPLSSLLSFLSSPLIFCLLPPPLPPSPPHKQTFAIATPAAAPHHLDRAPMSVMHQKSGSTSASHQPSTRNPKT